ncbi:calcium-activated chloride channel regulator 4-like [Marmota flaviventris]|uniref:calcium-activated chloride channel regulator 4-like n=1 Tax=Marmota flaviventris TaxID=93162 RepID=UPI003A85E0AD
MRLFRGLVSLLVLFLLQRSNTSLVRLNDNGYEDLVIAIDPGVPEDGKLIEQIKDMVTTASTYLFEATQKRFFFKNVSILIPENWEGSPEYKRPKHESYEQADVRVAAPALPGRDEPYTRQFTECGEKAEYIHFTPDFVLGKKQNEYGPSGRLFVHEWAHLRWGVFDEYNEQKPFYSGKSKKIEATRCSTGITGKNRVYKCQGGSCITRSCRTNSTTKLYEKDCQFFPNKVQTEKASIMFMQSIDSVLEFCNAENHNQEAPSLQNIKCNFRSTWEVISNSEDFKNTTPMAAPPPPPVFSLLRINERILCLVLDKSGSMSLYNRLNRMNQAAKYFLLQTVENGSWVGMVHFDSAASVKSELIQIKSDSEKNKLLESLPTVALGGTSICSGIAAAFQVIQKLNPQIDGSEIVLLTDGEDRTTGSCADAVKQSGAVIHLIALGPNADSAVTEMSIETGGKHVFASDEAVNNGLIDAFGALTSKNADPTQKSLQLESKGLTLNNDTWMNDTVIIDSTVGKDTFFLITWEKQPPSISLWNPNGTLTEAFTQDTLSKMAYLRIPGTAQVGTWTYSLQAKANTEILTMTVTSQAANSSVPPITVNAKMNKDTNSFPSPMIVYAQVLQGYLPILGASVTAIIESNSGKTQVLELLDNGAGADSFKDDGVYSRYFTSYSENGRYNLKVRAHGGTDSARRSLQYPLNRAAYIPGWVVDGKIEQNTTRPETTEDTQTILENFSRTASGGAFVVSQVPDTTNVPLPDLFPPSQITDLDATSEGDQINLTWTAPGDNFDVGTVRQYIIRISGSIIDLRDNFDDALQVNTTDLSPKEANSKETFAFKPGNISEENITHIFIAIQSVDKSNLTSKVSNIGQVALFIPQADPGPDESQPNPNPGESHPNHDSGVNISTVVCQWWGLLCLLWLLVLF